MRAVITGVAGFIGSHLCERLLSLGWEVVGVDCFRDYYDPEIKRMNLHRCLSYKQFRLLGEDLSQSNLNFLREGDYIFHLAAQPGVRKSWGREFYFYIRDNIESTQRLLEKAREVRPTKFIYASSSSVYGNSPSFPLKEDSPTRPFSPYGVTKLAGENLVLLYHENFGIPSISLRFFTVFGPRQRPDMAFHKAMRAIIMGEEFPIYGDGSQVRDFTYVQDTVDGIIKSAERGKEGRIYNLGSGREVTLLESLRIIERVTGKKIRIRFLPKAKGDVRKTLADISLAKRDLDYSPHISMEEGIEKEWNWIKNLYRI